MTETLLIPKISMSVGKPIIDFPIFISLQSRCSRHNPNKILKKSLTKYFRYLALAVLLLLAFSCNNNLKKDPEKKLPDSSDSSTSNNEIYISLEKMLGRLNRRNAQTVNVKFDHYFKSSKKYLGYPINLVIDSMMKVKKLDTSKATLIFECVDGYQPMMDLAKIFGNVKGYIVFKDLDEQNNKDWDDSINAKFKPYYLVWDNVAKNDDSFVWPYGLTAIRLVSTQKGYKSVYPSEGPSLIGGFNLFRDNCMKCHSLNNVGGSAGPEFNMPKNITEYWQEKDIILFARSPQTYRYNSRMPPITNLKDADFKEIILYLEYMKNKKLQK